ncbi:hypothetical protein D3C86_1675540 [compost metagenome]
MWINAQGRKQIVATDVFDRAEVILGRDLTDWDQLDAVFLPTRCIHEQVAEVARAFAALHGATQVRNEVLVLRRVGHVQNEAGMTAILVVLAPEQRRRFVQQSALQRRQPLR